MSPRDYLTSKRVLGGLITGGCGRGWGWGWVKGLYSGGNVTRTKIPFKKKLQKKIQYKLEGDLICISLFTGRFAYNWGGGGGGEWGGVGEGSLYAKVYGIRYRFRIQNLLTRGKSEERFISDYCIASAC